ncbi:C16orf89 [Branchiostoma lanceolatum]|uniref:C16orf89 protein n=1 Tax=Branchiostoma lanceolatum TaxID=7740 RepID=A0A8K0AD95_BRALA|nr:C16orf89 [Branchiostoma lanceolatum]
MGTFPGQLILLLESRIDDEHRVEFYDTVLDSLRQVLEEISDVANRTLPEIEARNPGYYEQFLEVVNKPYIIEAFPRTLEIQQDDQYKPSVKKRLPTFNEEESDKCMSYMMGSKIRGHDTKEVRCTITDRCWSLVTIPDTSAYVITHQLLYTVLAEHVGCTNELNSYARQQGFLEGVPGMQRRLCSSILSQAEFLARNGPPQPEQDLFMEQAVVCGMLGYTNFLRPDWLQKVMTWQRPGGCFGKEDPEEEKDELVEQLHSLPFHAHNYHGNIEHWVKTRSPTGRRLLVERLMRADYQPTDPRPPVHSQNLRIVGRRSRTLADRADDQPTKADHSRPSHRTTPNHGGCLSHKSGLGTALLAMYARAMMDPAFGWEGAQY